MHLVQFRKVFQHFRNAHTRSQPAHDVANRDAGISDARFAKPDVRVYADVFQIVFFAVVGVLADNIRRSEGLNRCT